MVGSKVVIVSETPRKFKGKFSPGVALLIILRSPYFLGLMLIIIALILALK
jgi:hypothetical protein